jgi:hypothetical protein
MTLPIYYLTHRLGPRHYRLLLSDHPPQPLGVFWADDDGWHVTVEHPDLPADARLFAWSGAAAVALKDAALTAGLAQERSQ